MSSRKRKAVAGEDDNYVEGSIIRIKLENIMTYDSVEFRCGPHLNLIIAPNGSGKSTIVCAICLGLGGKTSWLGRAQQPSAYIKHGKAKGRIEIELYNRDGENYIIQRQISKNNTSNWMVNGRAAALRTVEETVARLNIQLGNLCQFLPQEKVADFAKMSQQELLENTEKSVGSADMYENHQKLKSARRNCRILELNYSNLQQNLDQEIQKNSRLEREVQNFEEREHHLQQVRVLEMKRAWVEYEEMRLCYHNEKLQMEDLSEELKKAQREFRPLHQKLHGAEQKVKSLHAEMLKLSDKVKDHAKQAHEKSKQIETETDKIQEIYEDCKSKQEDEMTRKKVLHDLKRQMGALQNELSSIHDEDIQPAMDRVNKEARDINVQMTQNQQSANQITDEVADIRRDINVYQRELKELQNVSNRRLELLRRCHFHTYEAVRWLRANRHLFKGTIHEPMILTLNVKKPCDAKYIEQHASFNDMRAFVCENTEDLNLFMTKMRDEQQLKVNAICMPHQPVSSFKPPFRIEDFRKYDFQCFLKDMIECPDAIMRYLCLQYRVHSVMVGTERTRGLREQIIREKARITLFYTPSHQFSIRRSKYDSECSQMNNVLRKPRLLTDSLDTFRITTLQQYVQECESNQKTAEERYRKHQESSSELENQLNQLRSKKKELSKVRDRKRVLLSQIEAKKQSIARKENDGLDMDFEIKRAAEKIKIICAKKCQDLQILKKQTKYCFELGMARIRLSLKHAVAESEATDIEKLISDRSQSLQNLERKSSEMKDRLRRTKDQARQLFEVAKKTTGTGPDDELPERLKTSFETLPESVDEIDASIHEQRVRADCKFQSDEAVHVVQEYKARKKDITMMERELANQKSILENHEFEMERAKQEWMGPLKDLVTRINENFSFFFQSLQCSGEVDINVPDNPEDYEKYGMRIKVKFRDTEPLSELSPHHQSGGERSVATVLYMMALQELTRCPFRCVDEINQGMDPINERRVFEFVVNTVSRRNLSQYFLLTQKLLPDLEYSDNMTVLFVYNAPQIIDHTEWRLRKFIRRRVRLAQAEG